MCRISFKNNVYVVAKRSSKFRNKLDFYLLVPGRGYMYAFTRKYKKICCEAYKSPVILNKALHDRRPNVALMDLRKYFNYIMPYLVEYLELENFMLKSNMKKYRGAA